jgi:hypothetical protein
LGQKTRYIISVAALFLIVIGLCFISAVIYAQAQPLNLVASNGQDQDITLNPSDFPTYTFTVYAEVGATFSWTFDNSAVQSDNNQDGFIPTVVSQYTLVTAPLVTGDHILVCSQINGQDSITFYIHIVRTASPTPTQTPSSSPLPTYSYPTATPYGQTSTPHPTIQPSPTSTTPHPTIQPSPTSTSIIPILRDPTERNLLLVLSALFIGAGGFMLWIKKYF